jgi:hypothetical protein
MTNTSIRDIKDLYRLSCVIPKERTSGFLSRTVQKQRTLELFVCSQILQGTFSSAYMLSSPSPSKWHQGTVTNSRIFLGSRPQTKNISSCYMWMTNMSWILSSVMHITRLCGKFWYWNASRRELCYVFWWHLSYSACRIHTAHQPSAKSIVSA